MYSTKISKFATALLLTTSLWSRLGAGEDLAASLQPSFALQNGDINGDWLVDLSDAVSLFSHLYSGGPAPAPIACGEGPSFLQNGDANGDFLVDISDGVYLLTFLFAHGPDPIACDGSVVPAGGEDRSHRRPRIIPPGSRPFGRTYGEWLAKNWKWLYSLPVDHHPLFDTADVSTGQSGPVWYLGGTFTTIVDGNNVLGVAERTCTIPEGKTLFIPLIDAECATAEGNGTAEADLRACAMDAIDHAAGLSCVIDGVAVGGLAHFRDQSPLFTWGPLPANNVFQDPVNFPAGTRSPSVADGYMVMVAPLAEGKHKIHFTGSVVFTQAQDGFDFTFALDVTYHLTVKDSK